MGGGLGRGAAAVVSLVSSTLPHPGSFPAARPMVECHITREVDCACHHFRVLASRKVVVILIRYFLGMGGGAPVCHTKSAALIPSPHPSGVAL